MSARLLAIALVLSSLAGCVAKPAAELAPAADVAPHFSTALPSFAKFAFRTDVKGPTDPIDALLGIAHETSHAFDVADGTGELRVAIDVQPVGGAANVGDIVVRVLDAAGQERYKSPLLTKATKLVPILVAPAPGAYRVAATYRGLWDVAVVHTSIPTGYTPGIVVNVSSIEQTKVEHTFYPSRITAKAGEPTRITLFDYDPHAGTANLQHDLFLPALGIRTEGQTTWGEVRTLDFTAPVKAGEYEFYCEYHQGMLKGVLTVV